MPLGIKQGGINSPEFFSCYFDGLTKLLREKKIGCHMYNIFLAIILFADDICLLAPTRSTLDRLITLCSDYCSNHGLTFNPKKSKIMVFSGKRINLGELKPITMAGKIIDYVDATTYLGTRVVSDNGLSFSSADDLLSFYRASNAILNVAKKPSNEILMHLLYTNCIPTLTHACAVKEYPQREMIDCNTAVNDAIRKIFTFNRWVSVRELRKEFGYKALSEISAEAKRKFCDQLLVHHNVIVRSIARFSSLE